MALDDPEKDCSRRASLFEISPSGLSSVRTTSITSHGERGEDLEKALTPQTPQTSGPAQLSRQATSVRTTATTDPAYEVDWDGEDDKMNPRNWEGWYRGVVVFLMSFSTWVVIFYSTSYTSGMPEMMQEFGVTSKTVTTLGVTTYLAGLAVGAVVSAPLSEVLGRRPVYISSMFVFMLLVLPCALATRLVQILVWRFFGGMAGSVMVANAPGTIADIIDDEHRAFAFSMWSIGPMLGPIWGPLIGGFVTQYLGWRWTNWLVLIFAGVALVFVLCVRETYAPAILRRKARRLRKETRDERWWSRYDEKLALGPLLKMNLFRPFSMTATEPICQFWGLYVAVVYGILYLCFIAYPIVFSEVRGWSPSMSGLAFLGIGLGALMAVAAEPLIRRVINSHKVDEETGKPPPEAMVFVICVAAILTPVGELWFAWTCVPKELHWVWCILAGVPFGIGNTLTFIYATSYVAQSYGIYSASALAGNTVARCIVGGLLPLAGPALYRNLHAHWAGTLLGLLEVALIPIPFVFYKYGHKIRRRSALIRRMQEDQQKLAGKRGR
ncbi:MAG: hypothetical protein M1832_001535 [Thelocarpon impressellum]|nr:MAG: hypothetical protein M1832_001535 [Thelocarpon impressellum]